MNEASSYTEWDVDDPSKTAGSLDGAYSMARWVDAQNYAAGSMNEAFPYMERVDEAPSHMERVNDVPCTAERVNDA